MIDVMTWEERRAILEAEREQWPVLYQTVRDATARGFVPDAYGYPTEGPPYQRPPTKFNYPAGGLAYPHHVDGPAEGARFGLWAFADRSPDEIRHEPVWHAGDTSSVPLRRYSRSGLTFDQALDHVIDEARHVRAHYVVPDWEDGSRALTLPLASWRALLAVPDPAPAQPQLSLFDPVPETPTAAAKRVIAAALRPGADDEPVLIRPSYRDLILIERLIDSENYRRSRAERGARP